MQYKMEETEVREMVAALLEDEVLEKVGVVEIATRNEDSVLKPETSKDVNQHNAIEKNIAQNITSLENEASLISDYNLCKPQAKYTLENIILVTGDYESYKFQSNKERYLKGCKWSPDGTCLLTSCVDNKLRLYDTPTEFISAKSWKNNSKLPELDISLKVEEGGLVYDYCWFPAMNSWNPISCCFLSTANEEPVHLWDAFTGELRASYRSYNYADDLSYAYSLTFNPSGERIYCGFRDSVRIFDTAIPGRSSTSVNIKEESGQMGIVSCVAFNPTFRSSYAVGTYQKEVGLYSEETGSGLYIFKGHNGGITHLLFSPDGNRLYSGSRKDSEIVCWDVRNPGAVLFSMLRSVNTQQRIYFDLTPDGSMLMTGNTDGSVRISNVNDLSCDPDSAVEMLRSFNAHNDCCNGVSINPICPVLATTSGQRHVPDLISESDDDDDGDDDFEPIGNDGEVSVKKSKRRNPKSIFNFTSLKRKVEDCVKLWWIGDTVSTEIDI